MQETLARSARRERRADVTRERLYQAALDEFRRVGFDRANVASIARAAGVSRPSFYFHFPTKEHVLLELQWHLAVPVVERVRGCDSLRAALFEFVDGLVAAEAIVEDPEVYRDMLRIYVRRPEWLPLEDDQLPMVMEVRRWFDEGQRSGELRDGLTAEQGSRLFLTGVFGLMIGTAETGESRRDDLRKLVTLFLDGGGS
jgi:AcrR family transcriptional regulator